MFSRLEKSVRDRLWTHQCDALDFAIQHLNNHESPCLIRMPTGTGKTGVIGCLTRIANERSSLVLTPWAHLRNQMVSDLQDGRNSFWQKRRIEVSPTPVVPIFPSDAEDAVHPNEKTVFVATFATLNQLRREHYETYKSLAASISLIVVDEGHYEPAVEWGRSVKDLACKTVLLTATPYRNDLKLFQITDPAQSTHHFTHREAVKNGIIRKLRFDMLDSNNELEALSSAFASVWKKAKREGSLASPHPRAIICCASDEDINRVVVRLTKEGLSVIGIHEQFENEEDERLVKLVPDPKKEEAEIWVHQNKLTEGFDDHRFCCLVLFTRIRNDRKLIQQIGRVLRRNDDDRHEEALLIAPPEFAAQSEWNAYLDFEIDLKLLDPLHFRRVVDNLLTKQPEVEYFDGRFRRRFVVDDLPHRPQVIIPPSVLVRLPSKTFSLEEYIKDCTDTLNTADAVILGPDINKPCQQRSNMALWVYASVRNSRYLQNTSLYEVKLETHCVVVADEYVFMADSSGNYPEECIETHTRRVPVKQLSRFIDSQFRPTNVSVNSTIPYDTVIKGADLRGHNLLSIASSLTDRLHICRAARGISREHGRRYVGMSNARLRKEVTEEERRNYEPRVFVAWAQEVAAILKSKVTDSILFHRYMPVCDPPLLPIPRTVSLDIARSDIELKLADGNQCHLVHSSATIEAEAKETRTMYTCRFAIGGKTANVGSISLRLEYQPKKDRFWFNKHCGAAVQVTTSEEDLSTTKSLAEFLNSRQDIVLISLDDGETVYQDRNFYRIDYSYGEKALLDLIVQPRTSYHCSCEKGSRAEIIAIKKAGMKKFPNGSLFRAVADRKIDLPFVPEVLVCTDMGTECADFLAVNFSDKKLALVHAKAGDGNGISASAFHEVVAQAQKNLVYLTRSAGVPKGVRNWKRKSGWNGTKVPRLVFSMASTPEGAKMWDRIKSEIINTSNPELYVILVTTGCCNLEKLRRSVAEPACRTPETAQLLHLLDGLNNYARQLGIRLVIHDVPYMKQVSQLGKKSDHLR